MNSSIYSPSNSSSNSSNYSRRDFLRQILFWAASTSIIGCSDSPSNTPPIAIANKTAVGWLNQSIGNFESASRLGKVYFAAHPDENTVEQLLDNVNKALQAQNNSTIVNPHSLENISRVIKSDYVRGDTVLVDSWIISRTEARLYALVALSF